MTTICIAVATFWSCGDSVATRYKQLEEDELQSGKRQDSLFKGLYFGMKHQEFRDYCYRKNIIDHDFKNTGPNSTWVISKIPKGMRYPGVINFYPVFRRGVIAEMNAMILYDYENGSDAPFTRESLLEDVIQLMTNLYGASFHKIKSPDELGPDVYVSVRGNRRITIYPPVTADVRVRFVDLANQPGGRWK